MNFLTKPQNIPLSEINPATIAAWKLKYGEVFQIENAGKIGYFRNLSKLDYKSGSLKKAFGNDLVDTAIKTLKITFLGGDKEFIKKADCALSAMNVLEPIYEKKLKSINPNFK